MLLDCILPLNQACLNCVALSCKRSMEPMGASGFDVVVIVCGAIVDDIGGRSSVDWSRTCILRFMLFSSEVSLFTDLSRVLPP